MPAVAGTQRGLVILSLTRLKGCVGASFEFIGKPGHNSETIFNLWKWNYIEVIGIVKVKGRIQKY